MESSRSLSAAPLAGWSAQPATWPASPSPLLLFLLLLATEAETRGAAGDWLAGRLAGWWEERSMRDQLTDWLTD